ncbi:hypothetical protein VX159_03240 [Dechloromonas sp. ZY10]|uniref:hypothetical protein n=1 Tax=Dechloromonas aquae TaxID=2664436 RepID=UPI0035291636
MTETDSLSLHAAAERIATGLISTEDAEILLARAIEHGELAANIQRWATEQWEGQQLPGNLNRHTTRIRHTDLAAWQSRRP